MTEKQQISKLRNRLLSWHYSKSKTLTILDLLQSNYQSFRYRVQRRLQVDELDFRQAIKKATLDELQMLDEIKNCERLGI
jgi:hypothetical protein